MAEDTPYSLALQQPEPAPQQVHPLTALLHQVMASVGFGPKSPQTIYGQRLQHYPDVADVANARASDFSYGSGNEGFNEGRVANVLSNPAPPGQRIPIGLPPQGATASQLTNPALGGIVPGTAQTGQGYEAAQLAVLRSAIAALGYNPRNTNLDVKTSPQVTTAGVYTPANGGIYSNASFPANIVHESAHRGMETLRQAGAIPPELQKRLPPNEESIIRYIMALHMGDPEKNRGPVSDEQRSDALWYFGKNKDDPQAYSRSAAPKAAQSRQALEDLNMIASRYMLSQHPGGPR